MDAITQQNAALVEQAAAAAESLQEQAQALGKAVSIFRLRAAAAQHPGRARHGSHPRRGGLPDNKLLA